MEITMSKEKLIGSLLLTAAQLPNDRISELTELGVLLGGDNGPAWKAFLKRTRAAGLPVQPPATKPSVLKLVNNSVSVEAVTTYDPSGFKTRPGLWVSNEFHSRVGSKTKPVENLGAITLSSFDLIQNAYDKGIEADPAMPANHVFASESEFVACLDQMISKQPNGEEGDLLTNGYWNIFYVAGCVVSVDWSSGRREWDVCAWSLGDGRWLAGYRAFGCN
jgi:hypothetical protein